MHLTVLHQKISHTVSDIAVKTRENRSDKPETFYHISPTKNTDEETFSLGDSSVDSGELGAEFASKLKFDERELKLYTLQHDDDDDIILTHETAKKFAKEIKSFPAITTASGVTDVLTLGGEKLPPDYSPFVTPSASDTETASAGDTATGESFSLSTLGESKTLDVAARDPSAVADKSVESVESTAVKSSDTAASSAKRSDVHDLGATSAPYILSGPADTASVTETDNTGDTGESAAAESALLHTEETKLLVSELQVVPPPIPVLKSYRATLRPRIQVSQLRAICRALLPIAPTSRRRRRLSIALQEPFRQRRHLLYLV